MSKLYLQNIVDDIPFENLPAKWQGFDFARFSRDLSARRNAQAGPKGTEHADGYRKIDGYSRIFESGDPKQSRDFSYNGFTINTKLLLKPKRGIAEVPENYRQYWFDNFNDFARKIS